MSEEKERKKALIELHLSIFIVGFSGLFGKLIELPATHLIFYRCVISALFLYFYLKKSGLFPQNRILPERELKTIALTGVVLAAHWVTFFHSIIVSNVAIGVLTFSTFPLIIVFAEPFIKKAKLKISHLALFAISFAGVFLLNYSDENKIHQEGIIVGLISALLFSAYVLLNKKLVAKTPATKLTFYQTSVSSVILLPWILSQPLMPSGSDLFYLLILAVVITGIAQILFVGSMKKLSAFTASISLTLESVYSIIFAFILLGEKPGPMILAGGLLIMISALAVSLPSKKDA